jgi:hypothetical protein
MAIYEAWLLQAEGCGTLARPAWLGTPANGGLVIANGNAVPVPFGTPGGASANGNSVEITPIALNPNLVLLNASGYFPGVSKSYPTPHGGCSFGTFNVTDKPVVYESTVYVGTAMQTYRSGVAVPDVYLANVSSQTSKPWYEVVRVSFTEQAYCSANNTYWQQIPTLEPSVASLAVSGNYTTYLGYNHLPPRAIVANGNLTLNWTNSMMATVDYATVSVPGHNYNPSTSTTQGAISERFTFGNVPASGTGSLEYEINSSAGSGAMSGGATLNLAQTRSYSQPLVSATYCNFDIPSSPVQISWPLPSPITNVTGTDATVMWYANGQGQGWVQYSDGNGGVFEQIAQNHSLHNGNYLFVAELHGLDPWSNYTLTLGVDATGTGGGSCILFQATHLFYLLTAGSVPVTEHDLSYDSVSQTGGGASVQWSVPAWFVSSSTFNNGTLSYWPTSSGQSSAMQVPIANLASLASGWGWNASGQQTIEYDLNLTVVTLNTSYSTGLLLNFSYEGSPFEVFGAPLSFTYAQDTSGDGLTDAEKVQGWNVTFQNLLNQWESEAVEAAPRAYATNGLVSDYVEKEFELNPLTIDTAGSNMLDTWNLTFAVASHACPQDFDCWYENNTNPYSFSQYPNQAPAYAPARQNSTGPRTTVDDTSPYDATILWTGSSDLPYLQSLISGEGVGWLRAVTGSYNGQDTLTVWGKLSWGANPLSASTPLNGITDGSRLNATAAEDLEVTGLSTSVNSCPNPGSATWGWAVQFALYATNPFGPHEITNYSSAAYDKSGSGCGSISSYQVPIPLSATTQFQDVQVQVIMNEGGSGLVPLAINGTATNPGIAHYDMFAGHPTIYSYSSSSGASVSFTLQTVSVGIKVPTYLWLPTNNGTLNNLPWGLKRYTGEQAFDLLDLYNPTSGPLTLNGIAYAQNSSDQYTISLATGFTNLLVPRSQFMYSPLGQASLLGKVAQYTDNSAYPPLLSAVWNSISGFSSSPMTALACYWQNRAIASSTGEISGCNSQLETGTPISSNENLEVVAETAASGANTGGLPSVSAIENVSDEGAALQAMITVNVTTTTELDLLLAGLMDNVTGGYNGTLLSVTNQVDQLGLNPVVTDAMVNLTLSSSGLFGAPQSSSPPAPTSGLLSLLVNSVGGIAKVAGVILSAASWATYELSTIIDDHIPAWMKNLGAAWLTRSVTVLTGAGTQFINSIKWLASYAATLATSLLDSVITPAKTSSAPTNAHLSTDMSRADQNVTAGTPNKIPPESADAGNQGGRLLGTLLVIGSVTVMVIDVLMAIGGPITTLLITIIITAIMTLVMAYLDVVTQGAVSLGRAVWMADNLFNCTATQVFQFSCTPGGTLQQSDQGWWSALYDVIADKTADNALWAFTYGLATLSLGPNSVTAAFICAIIGVLLTVYAHYNPSNAKGAAILSVFVDFLSLYFDTKAAKTGTLDVGVPQVLAGVTVGLDAGSLVADVAYL